MCGFCWTVEDQAILEIRFRRHYKPADDDLFTDLVAWSLAGDSIDYETMRAGARSCESLREFGRMRTDWLIERALAAM